MTTIRIANKKKYTVLSNEIAQNNNLSLRARGLILYLMSLPDDWKIHVNHLVKTFKEGRKAILASLTELKESGYVHLAKSGYESGWTYFLFEEATSEEEFKLFLGTKPFRNSSFKEQFPKEHLQTPKPPYKEKTFNNKRNSAPMSEKIKVREKVKLTQKQINALKKKYSQEGFDWIVDKLNDWKITKNQETKSDNDAILRWVVGAYLNYKNAIQSNSKVKERNIVIAKRLISHLERIGARGNLKILGDEVYDSVLSKRYKLTNAYFSKNVSGWYGLNWD